MGDILWLKWQLQHIERRHGVTARRFQEAWDDPDREELTQEEDPSGGSTSAASVRRQTAD